jgi:hypothetical protein
MHLTKIGWALLILGMIGNITTLGAFMGASHAYADDKDAVVERSDLGPVEVEGVHWFFKPGMEIALDATLHYSAFVATVSAHIFTALKPVVPVWLAGDMLFAFGTVFGTVPILGSVAHQLIVARRELGEVL